MNKLSGVSAAAVLLTFASFASSETIVSDSFESGDMSKTSSYGFKWSDSKSNPVITVDALVPTTSSVNSPAPETSQWEAQSGSHALMMRYKTGINWKEKRFSFAAPQPEIWMSFWLRVPINYSHPDVGVKDNQKLFYLWQDGYSSKGEGSSVGMEFRGDGNGGSYFYGKISAGDYTGSGGDSGKTQFITVPRDRGRWMHLVAHIKGESARGAGDGAFRVWRKWGNETDYTQTQNLTNRTIRIATAVPGFANGYLMGYANAAYPVDTEFLIDDFALSTTPLFSGSVAPNSPSGLIVE